MSRRWPRSTSPDTPGLGAPARRARPRPVAPLRGGDLAAQRPRLLEALEGRAAADLPRPVLLPAGARLRARHLHRARINGIPYKEFVAPGPDRLGGDVVGGVRDHLQRLLPDERAAPLRQRPRRRRSRCRTSSPATSPGARPARRVYGTVVLVVVAAFGLISSPWAILIPPFVFARRPLHLGDRLHVHVADPEDRPLQLLLHPGDHADVPVLGDLLPVQPAARLGRGRRLVHARSTTWSRSRAGWPPARTRSRSSSTPPGSRR